MARKGGGPAARRPSAFQGPVAAGAPVEQPPLPAERRGRRGAGACSSSRATLFPATRGSAMAPRCSDDEARVCDDDDATDDATTMRRRTVLSAVLVGAVSLASCTKKPRCKRCDGARSDVPAGARSCVDPATPSSIPHAQVRARHAAPGPARRPRGVGRGLLRPGDAPRVEGRLRARQRRPRPDGRGLRPRGARAREQVRQRPRGQAHAPPPRGDARARRGD